MIEPGVYWLVLAAKPPEALSFLSSEEYRVLSTKRFAKRRAEWLNGRWAAKRLLHASHPELVNAPLDKIEINNSPEGVPYVMLNGRMLECSLSISHREQAAFCAVTFQPFFRVGADIERIESRSAAFVTDYFTASEAELICASASETHFLATLIWSAKEAMLKALGKGLRLDTRQVEVTRVFEEGAGWSPLNVFCPFVVESDRWDVRWQRWGDYVLTLAVLADKVPPAEWKVHLVKCTD